MNDRLIERPATLCDVLDRILNQGVVVHGEITISVAGVDLLYISLRGLVSAVDAINRQSDFVSRYPLPDGDLRT